MNITKLRIQNFRGIADVTYDEFTDELERVNTVTLIVGPNGSGKSSILDAIWFGLQSVIGYPMLRRSFRTEPEYLVRIGQNHAKVDYHLRINEKERQRIQSWKRELIELKAVADSPENKLLDGHITWTYPAQPGYKEERYGGYIYQNSYDWDLVNGYNYARRLRQLKAYNTGDLDLAGSIYLFEQERQIIANPLYSVPVQDKQNAQSNGDGNNREPDILERLVNWGLKALLNRPQSGEHQSLDQRYNKIREGYNYICNPNEMGDVISTYSNNEYAVEFKSDDDTKYTFYGLSSGERSVLDFLVKYHGLRIYNSIVLIDELELHLHPIWQRRLLQYLQRQDDGNQLIITTHSPTLRGAVLDESVIELGEIEEHSIPSWQRVSLQDEE